MDYTSKTTEELLVYAVLSACGALWVQFIRGSKRCEKQNEKFEAQIISMHNMLHSNAEKMSERGEERERLLASLVQKVTESADDNREVLIRAIRILRRYGQEDTPLPSESPEYFSKPARKLRDDETSAIFRDELKKGGR